MTSAKHTSKTSKDEFGRDSSPPNPFRYTFEDKLEKKMTSAEHASQTSKMESGKGPSLPNQFRYTLKTTLKRK